MTRPLSEPTVGVSECDSSGVSIREYALQTRIEGLAARYQNRLLHLAASCLRDIQSAEDCVQDVFVTALRKLNPELSEGATYKWLATCTANRAKSMLRSVRLRRLVFMDANQLDDSGLTARDEVATGYSLMLIYGKIRSWITIDSYRFGKLPTCSE